MSLKDNSNMMQIDEQLDRRTAFEYNDVVSTMSIIRSLRSRLSRQQRWSPRLRAEQGVITLLLVLMIGLGDPFACLMHCRFWSVFATSQGSHDHHQHTTPAHHASADPQQHAATSNNSMWTPRSDPACHAMMAPASGPRLHPDTSFNVLHGHLAALLVVTLWLASLSLTRLPTPGPAPPPAQFALAPPLRPPKLAIQ
jgi:hypothetical protein